MADLFNHDDVIGLLRGKSFLFMGDSIMRNIYKDFVTLLDDGSKNRLIKVRTIFKTN